MARKRNNGEGSVTRLPSGSWRCQIMDGYYENGKRKTKSFTAANKAEALEKMREYLGNKPMPGAEIDFCQYAEKWYKQYENQVEQSTYSNYRYTLNILKDAFDGKKLGDIKTSDINIFMNSLESKLYSASTISKCRSMLIQIMDIAEADDLIQKNYARKAFNVSKRLKTVQHHNKKDAFTLYEVQNIFKYLPENDKFAYSIKLLFITGIRVQELLALTNEDLAEDGSYIVVNKEVKMVNGKPVLGSTKSYKSNRVIPVSENYRYIPLWLKNNCGKAFILCAPYRESLLYSTSTFRRKFKRFLSKIPEVRVLTPHSCRHTYVSMLQKQGVPMETIARLTGHTDIKTTDNYLHISDESLYKSVEKLNNLLDLNSGQN